MVEKVTIGRRGAMTIPARLRRVFGLRQHDELIIEATEEGLLMRPAVSMPVELYSEERIAEFAEDDEAVGRNLAKLADRRAGGNRG